MRPLILCATRSEAEHFMLARLLRKSGLDSGKVVVRFLHDDQLQPPDDDPFWSAPTATADEVDQWVAQERTNCVVTMGQEPLMMAFGEHDTVRWLFRQVPHPRWGTVIPMFEPSRFLPYRGKNVEAEVDPEDEIGSGRPRKARGITAPARFQGWARRMFQLATVLAKQPPPVRLVPRFICDPAMPVWETWVETALGRLAADPTLVLNHDLETAYHLKRKGEEDTDEETIDYDSTITRFSFALNEEEGVSVPYAGPYREGIDRLLGSPHAKCGWNCWAFDEEIQVRNQLPIAGIHFDAQDAWHMLQSDLPRGLEWVTGLCSHQLPWKHLGDADPALYSAIDSTTNVGCFYWVRRQLEQQGLWPLYMRQVRLHTVLAAAGRRGLLVNDELRQALELDYSAKLRDKLLQAQTLVGEKFLRKKLYKPKVVAPEKPVRLNKDGSPRVSKAKPKPAPKPVDPKRARENWVWATQETQITRKICKACRRPNINRKHACKVDPQGWNEDYTKMFDTEVVTEVREYKAGCAPGASLAQVQEWLKYNGFNPNSSDQVLKYMKFHRHPVGFNPKTEEDSADTKHLLKLSKTYGERHPIYAHIVDVHRLAKALSTYVIGMKPDAKGLVYTTYVNVPSTWRLASRNKNLQNQSKRAANKYAKATRKMFVSRYPSTAVMQEAA